jgi:hypothetical protein
MSNTSPHDPKLDLLKPLQSPVISSFATVHVTSKQRGPVVRPEFGRCNECPSSGTRTGRGADPVWQRSVIAKMPP